MITADSHFESSKNLTLTADSYFELSKAFNGVIEERFYVEGEVERRFPGFFAKRRYLKKKD